MEVRSKGTRDFREFNILDVWRSFFFKIGKTYNNNTNKLIPTFWEELRFVARIAHIHTHNTLDEVPLRGICDHYSCTFWASFFWVFIDIVLLKLRV